MAPQRYRRRHNPRGAPASQISAGRGAPPSAATFQRGLEGFISKNRHHGNRQSNRIFFARGLFSIRSGSSDFLDSRAAKSAGRGGVGGGQSGQVAMTSTLWAGPCQHDSGFFLASVTLYLHRGHEYYLGSCGEWPAALSMPILLTIGAGFPITGPGRCCLSRSLLGGKGVSGRRGGGQAGPQVGRIGRPSAAGHSPFSLARCICW